MAAKDLTPNQLLRAARHRQGLSREGLADACNRQEVMAHSPDGPMTANFIAKLEQGRIHFPRASQRREALRTVLDVARDADIGLARSRRRPSDRPPHTTSTTPLQEITGRSHRPWIDAADLDGVRQLVTGALRGEGSSPATVDDWEQIASEHAIATRTRPAPEHLFELVADFAELSTDLGRRLPARSMRRLTRVTAHMSGLVFLTLIKLEQRQAARGWARTARIAAHEADDDLAMAWVRAQEAYVHYYSGNLHEAVHVARHAQDLSRDTASAGGCLAAALEARAHASMADEAQARAAINRAEATLGRLTDDALIPSAFGYNEAQLRFHEGNALTVLGDTQGAHRAHQQAFALYPAADYLDRALVSLDGAQCLILKHDVPGATAIAAAVLRDLTPAQRQGLVRSRGLQLFNALPIREQQSRTGRDLHDLLVTV